MIIKIIKTKDEFSALKGDWLNLQKQVPQILPFQSFEWNKTWWDCFSIQGNFRRDELCIVTFWVDQKLVGVLPLFTSRFGIYEITIYRYTRPFGSDPNLTEIRTPLILKDHLENAIDYWMQMIIKSNNSLCRFQIIAPSSQITNSTIKYREILFLEKRIIPNYILNLSENWDDFKKSLKRNIKESLRHCYNSLTKDKLSFEFITLTSRDTILENIDLFYMLHKNRASLKSTISHPNYFHEDKHRKFLENFIQSFDSDAQNLCLFCLKINNEIVAMRFGFIFGDEIYLYYSGYNHHYGKYSVMTTLVAEIIKWSIEKKLKRVNLSIGNDVSKTRWNPEEVSYTECSAVKNNKFNKIIESIVHIIKRNRKSSLLSA
ncbi:MAG: hypothetical protein FD135_1564 [Comamonadaceae bacterium]|nr:MAG: hypothetical protein FD135_1564 [Comamonadaceae bacterium]